MPGMSGDQIATTLLKALPTDLAEQVLKRLAQPTATRLRTQLIGNNTSTPSQLDESLTEFFDLYRIAERGRTLGVLDDKYQAASPSSSTTSQLPIIDLERESDAIDPIESLRSLPPEKLLKVLEGESPAAITLILSVLEPPMAAAILRGLSAELRPDVAMRFTRPGDRNYSIIKQLAKAVNERGRKMEESVTTAPPDKRIADLAKMLRSLPRPDRVALLQTIDTTDSELGAKVREKLYRFDDVLILDDKSMQGLLSQMNLKVIAKCLKGAEEPIAKKITNNISARARDLLQEEISLLGNVSVAQTEEARNEFLAALRQAEEQGTLTIGE